MLIVAQVAFAVAVLPWSGFHGWDWARHGFAEPGFAAAEFLMARIVMDREILPSGETEAYEREFAARYGSVVRELVRRLEAEPGVADVTFASRPVGEPLPAGIQVEGVPAPLESPSGHRTRVNRVDVGFFEAFDVPILAGRGFRPGDVGAATPAIVNHTFVEQVLGGRNAIGRRFRYIEQYQSGSDGEDVQPIRWYGIVGVVSDVLTVASTQAKPGFGCAIPPRSDRFTR